MSEMNLGDLEFKAGDFLEEMERRNLHSPNLTLSAFCDLANRILAEKLGKVLSVRLLMDGDWPWDIVCDGNAARTHTARLVCVEEIKRSGGC